VLREVIQSYKLLTNPVADDAISGTDANQRYSNPPTSRRTFCAIEITFATKDSMFASPGRILNKVSFCGHVEFIHRQVHTSCLVRPLCACYSQRPVVSDHFPACVHHFVSMAYLPTKRKLMAAFGFVTPDGDRFEGLSRAGSRSVPLVQVMLGARETNQGLTFLRLQHIHIMEPNPPRIHAITHVFCKTKKVVAWRLQSIEKCRTRMSKGAISDCSTAPNTATEGFVQAACSLSIFVLLYQ
jgi:hypothetical protein